MRIVVVTYWYPPATTPRAIRWASLVEHWASQGHHVDVVCAGSLDQSDIARKDDGVSVHRVSSLFGRVLYRMAIARSAAYRSAPSGSGNAPPRISTTVAKYLHDCTWKKLYWPDHACLWYPPAVRKAKKLIALNTYDALISVSLPFTGHLVGLVLKKSFPSLRWLADVGDPFCFLTSTPLNNHRLYRRLNRYCEHKVFKRAEYIVVTTEQTLNRYKSIFPEAANKLLVIPPLLSPQRGNTSKRFFLTRDKMRLVFSGTLYQKIRSPEFVLELFRDLLRTELSEKLELHFLGTLGNCPNCFDRYNDLIGSKVFLHGPVSHEAAIQAMSEADCLVNIGNDTDYQLPSKVVEYASMGKPVLCLAKKEKDSSITFFRQYPLALCVIENEGITGSDLTHKVLQFLRYPPAVDKKRCQEWLARFEVPAVAGAYESVLVNAIGARRSNKQQEVCLESRGEYETRV